MSAEAFQLGLEVLASQGHEYLKDARIGLLANQASVDCDLNHALERITGRWPGQVEALFTPQHGLWGDAQANMIETDHGWHQRLGIPVYSLYSETRRPTDEMLGAIDCLVIDLQDVGTRIYTFAWTVLECLRACAESHVRVLVLDRPNPLGIQIVEGPELIGSFSSFVGGATIPMRHALTLGELARMFHREESLGLDLQIVPMVGYESGGRWCDLDRLWIPPSPNVPTMLSVDHYPGQVLLEGTNLSEGRGTTIPFQLLGAPFIEPEAFAEHVRGLRDDSFRILPTQFRPTFDKWANQSCGGVSLHIMDPERYRAFSMTIRLLEIVLRLHPNEFQWLDPPYEYETVKPPIDILYGNDRLRTQLGTRSWEELSATVELDDYGQRLDSILLYSDGSRFRA